VEVADAPMRKNGTRPKRLIPGDPEDVAFVQMVFRRYATTDISLRKLAHELNAKGIPTPRAKRGRIDKRSGRLPQWNVRTLGKLLKCRTYLGESRWGKREVKKGTHEPLIDRELFDAVQRKLAACKERWNSNRTGEPMLFSGLLYCSVCGEKMYGVHIKRKLKRYEPFYCCSGGRYYGRAMCKQREIKERILLDRVIECVRNITGASAVKPEDKDGFAKAWRKHWTKHFEALLREQARSDPGELKRIKSKLAELKEKLDKGSEAYLLAPPEERSYFLTKLSEWRGEQARLTELLAEREAQLVTPAMIRDIAERAADGMALLHMQIEDAPPDRQRAIIRHVFQKIVIHFQDERRGKHISQSVPKRITVTYQPDAFTARGLARLLLPLADETGMLIPSSKIR
jgi:hypothetical protein